jgi:hypothetical protein
MMKQFRCSECGHVIGPMLDKFGRPEMFKCHRYDTAAKMVPDTITSYKTPKKPKDLDAIDLSHRAKKKTPAVVEPLNWAV